MITQINKRSQRLKFGACLALAASVILPLLVCAQEVARPYNWVNDFAGVISPDDNERLTALIADVEQKTGAEIAVVTQDSIAPYDEKDYANKLFDMWKVGKRGKDNGVIVLLVVKERRWRIQTGYGLEGILPDSLCGEIGRNYMVSYFKEGKYSQGLYNGVSAIAQVILRDAGVTSGDLAAKAQKRAEPVPFFFYIFAPLFFFVWNLPWPFIIGLPFTLLFALAFYHMSPVLGGLVIVGYLGSLYSRYKYWHKLPPDKRNSFFGVQSYGGTFNSGNSGGGFSSGGFGGFGGGSSGGGGAGGGF